MIAQSVDLARELYFAILMDRASKGPVMVASPQGGMDIETVAHETPDLIFRVCVCFHSVRFYSGQTNRNPSTSTLVLSLNKQGDWLKSSVSILKRRSLT